MTRSMARVNERSDDDHWLDVLRHNGFEAEDLRRWLPIARECGFRKVASEHVRLCPDCGSPGRRALGQQVYYSTLMRLVRCDGCGLVYIDTRLAEQVTYQHFETAYKDAAYFLHRRRDIFRHLAVIVDDSTRAGACVLDIGGAEGHLLATLARQRPDLTLVLNDLSPLACRYGAESFGLETICAGIADLASLERRFDALLMIDVIYYESDLKSIWSCMTSLLEADGIVVLRLPNKYAWMRVMEWLRRLVRSRDAATTTMSVRLFNPEHIYVFTRKYLSARLKENGFDSVQYLPSPFLRGSRAGDLVRGVAFRLAQLLSIVSLRTLVATPSMVVVARRRGARGGAVSA